MAVKECNIVDKRMLKSVYVISIIQK